MDASLASGFSMTLIGMGTVFVALVGLLLVVKLMPRILGQPQTVASGSIVAASAGSLGRGAAAERREASDDELRTVALAAYSYHRRRQTSARSPTASSPWSSAGRLAQIAPFRR